MAEAVAADIEHEVFDLPFAEVDRALTDADEEGLARMITDRRGRIIGVAIVGAQAGELIHEFALAMSRNLRAADVAGLIHVYPTLAQVYRRVAELPMKRMLTPKRRLWLQRVFLLRGDRRT